MEGILLVVFLSIYFYFDNNKNKKNDNLNKKTNDYHINNNLEEYNDYLDCNECGCNTFNINENCDE